MSAREVIARELCKLRNEGSMVGYCVGVAGDDCAGDCAHFAHTDEVITALSAAGFAVVPVEQSDTRAADLARTRALLAGSGEMGGTRHAAAQEDSTDA